MCIAGHHIKQHISHVLHQHHRLCTYLKLPLMSNTLVLRWQQFIHQIDWWNVTFCKYAVRLIPIFPWNVRLGSGLKIISRFKSFYWLTSKNWRESGCDKWRLFSCTHYPKLIVFHQLRWFSVRFYIQYSHNSNYDRTCNWQICRHTPSLLCHELSLTTKKPEHNVQHFTDDISRKISYIRRTKSQNLNDSHLVLKSSLPKPLKPGVKSRMKM